MDAVSCPTAQRSDPDSSVNEHLAGAEAVPRCGDYVAGCISQELNSRVELKS